MMGQHLITAALRLHAELETQRDFRPDSNLRKVDRDRTNAR
jgi:hypothetical protein